MWRKERFKDMEELFKEFEFNESTTCDITEINGMQLPRDYLEFMHEHNGGEGDLGGNHFCYNFITNEYFAVDCCTGGLEDSYCKAVSLYKFIKNWDKQFEEENNYEI